MLQVRKTSLWGLIDNALSLTPWQRWRGGRNRAARPRRARPEVEALEDRAVPAALPPAVLTLGVDGNLWLENPGQTTRTWVDGNVRSFAHGSDGYYYVLGTNGALWRELPGWQTSGRTWVDGNVQSFALGSDGYDYVLGTNGALWKELPGWQTSGRTWVDGSVRSFALGSDGYDYVLGTNGNLWKELPGWQSFGRTWVDGSVQSYAHGSDGYDYVLGTNGNLWKELPGWQSFGHTWVDGNVQNFSLGSDGYDYVLGTNGALWRELPGWQTSGRTSVNPNAQSFAHGSDGDSYVLGTTTGNVKYYMTNQNSLAGEILNNLVVLDANPKASAAYSPVSGTLFGPNGPSYLDVQQGKEADCWLMASLAEVADRNPNYIKGMFTDDGPTYENGSQVEVYTVRFYDNNGVAQYVTVDSKLPGGGTYYARPVGGPGAVNGSATPVLWAALAEKAYAVADGLGYVTGRITHSNAYDALGNNPDAQGNTGGMVRWAYQAIIGGPGTEPNINLSQVASAWNAGQMVVLCTPPKPGPNASSAIMNPHCYALVGYSGGVFRIYNPYGTDSTSYGYVPGSNGTKYGLMWVTQLFLTNNFSTQAIGPAIEGGAALEGPSSQPSGIVTVARDHSSHPSGVVAAPPVLSSESFSCGTTTRGREGQYAWCSQELADLSFIEDLLDAHSKNGRTS
jgi:hypothetical protein